MRLLLTAVLMMSAAGLLAQEQAAEGASPMTNLVSFFDKCRAGGPVTVAYIGGSITAQNGWRPFTTAWLKKKFKDCEIREVNAAIGGTGSYLGVFRLEKHVLQFDPDLVFVEFAVNDNGAQDEAVMSTMEGIVRQCWMREKKPAIVFTYTTAHTLQVPTHRHQAVADYYGIPPWTSRGRFARWLTRGSSTGTSSPRTRSTPVTGGTRSMRPRWPPS